jgi:hypothetical protein
VAKADGTGKIIKRKTAPYGTGISADLEELGASVAETL